MSLGDVSYDLARWGKVDLKTLNWSGTDWKGICATLYNKEGQVIQRVWAYNEHSALRELHTVLIRQVWDMCMHIERERMYER